MGTAEIGQQVGLCWVDAQTFLFEVIEDLVSFTDHWLARFRVDVEVVSVGARLAFHASVIEEMGEIASNAGVVGGEEGIRRWAITSSVNVHFLVRAHAAIVLVIGNHGMWAGSAFMSHQIKEEGWIAARKAGLASKEGKLGRALTLLGFCIFDHVATGRAL